MAEGKKSVILYIDLIHTVEQLPDDKAGLLFKHLLRYVNDQNPVTDDMIINIAFEPIKQYLKRDLIKYESICVRNKNNGSKGGRPKNQKKPKKPTGLNGNPKKPKKPDIDIVIDNDIEIKETPLEIAFNNFKQMRKEKKKPLTENAEQLIKTKLNKLANNDNDRIKILENSIMNSWQGIFELDKESKEPTKVHKTNYSYPTR